MNPATIMKGAAVLSTLVSNEKVANRMSAAGITLADLQRAASSPDGIPEKVGKFVRSFLGDAAGEFVQDMLSTSEREARVDAARETALTFADQDDGDMADLLSAYGAGSLVVGASELGATADLARQADVHFDFYNNIAALKRSLGLDDVGYTLLVDFVRLVGRSDVGYAHALKLPSLQAKHDFIDGKLTPQRRADILKKVANV